MDLVFSHVSNLEAVMENNPPPTEFMSNVVCELDARLRVLENSPHAPREADKKDITLNEGSENLP